MNTHISTIQHLSHRLNFYLFSFLLRPKGGNGINCNIDLTHVESVNVLSLHSARLKAARTPAGEAQWTALSPFGEIVPLKQLDSLALEARL